jgi:gas vesicle protein
MAEFHLGRSSNRRKQYTNTFLLFLMGFGIGAVAGILSAPKSGKQLRKDIGRKVEDARDKMEEVGDQVGKRAGELFERGEKLVEAAKRTAEPVTRMIRPA